jgi:hypothetical protein
VDWLKFDGHGMEIFPGADAGEFFLRSPLQPHPHTHCHPSRARMIGGVRTGFFSLSGVITVCHLIRQNAQGELFLPTVTIAMPGMASCSSRVAKIATF